MLAHCAGYISAKTRPHVSAILGITECIMATFKIQIVISEFGRL